MRRRRSALPPPPPLLLLCFYAPLLLSWTFVLCFLFIHSPFCVCPSVCVVMLSADIGQRLRAIHSDHSKSPEQRARDMQAAFVQSLGHASVHSHNNNSNNHYQHQKQQSQHQLRSDRRPGCEHYERSCSIKAPCCGSFFPCRLCHDQHAPSSNGCTATLDRYSIATMICTLCELQQPASQFCQTSVGGCGQQMSAYYCDTCHLWDDDSANTGIFHCDACGMCRRGNQNDFFHCDTCGVCLSVDLRNNHRCIERSLDSDCPICGEYMQTSRRDITIAPGCGHAMHLECRQQATAAGYYQCPLCMKSAVDATGLFERLDKLVAAQPMPPEFANRRASIACNDCSEHSEVALRFDYHKCSSCGSYNTRILDTFVNSSASISTALTEPTSPRSPTSPSSEVSMSYHIPVGFDPASYPVVSEGDADWFEIDDPNFEPI